MSRAGCPYEGLPSWAQRADGALLQQPEGGRFYFHTDEQLDYAVAAYAYLWYNQIRLHSYNNYLTPLEARNTFV